jgi:hypothetical protein
MKDMKKSHFFGNPCEMHSETKALDSEEGMEEISGSP